MELDQRHKDYLPYDSEWEDLNEILDAVKASVDQDLYVGLVWFVHTLIENEAANWKIIEHLLGVKHG